MAKKSNKSILLTLGLGYAAFKVIKRTYKNSLPKPIKVNINDYNKVVSLSKMDTIGTSNMKILEVLIFNEKSMRNKKVSLLDDGTYEIIVGQYLKTAQK